ncbi:MAG: hypothetical protein QNJ97_13335 [Myxococcota bacterium]|nr:hypothetical protein [Myxococcota bacterium]
MFLSNAYEEIRKYNADIVGFYYYDLAIPDRYTAQEASEKMDEFTWTSGWRMEDVDNVIWNGGCPDDCVFNTVSTFITVETATMKVVGYGGLYLVEDVLEDLKKINQK